MFGMVETATTPVVLTLIGNLNKSAMTNPVKKVLNGAFDGSLITTLANMLTSSNSIYKFAFEKASNIINNIVKPVGIAFIVTFFVIAIFGELQRDSLTLEALVKHLIMLVIVFSIASQSDVITQKTLMAGDLLITKTSTKVGIKYSKEKGKFIESKKKKSKGPAVDVGALVDKAAPEFAAKYGPLSLFIAIFIWAIAKISQLGIFVAVISRGIELVFRAIFLPIGLADSFNGGQSGGISYMKGFLSTAFDGAVVLIIVVIGQTLTLSVLAASPTTTVNRLMQFIIAASSMMATAKMAISAATKTGDLIG